MAYVAGYDYDVFISYAHVDNEPFLPGGKGWVTSLIDGLRKLMAVKLGRTDSFSLWMDYALRGAEPVTPQLLNTVRNSAMLIVILSPGYLASDWCRRERDAFLGIVQARGARRVFVVERDSIKPAGRRSCSIWFRFASGSAIGKARRRIFSASRSRARMIMNTSIDCTI